jgi:hypothetical protein
MIETHIFNKGNEQYQYEIGEDQEDPDKRLRKEKIKDK